MISLFVPGAGPLHRMPAGVKLAGLALCALAISLYPHGAVSVVAILTAATAAYPLARLPWRVLAASWWRMRWLVLVLGGALWVFAGADAAVVAVGRMVSLLLLADLVTATTRMGELLDVLRRMLRPLRRVGIDPEGVAMTLSLTLAMIPVVAGFAERVREAQRARGVRLGVRAAVPLLVMTMRHADDVGDALAARGLVR
ncbi:energy-coupling factor transporter transmembrane component T family protein [Microbacterium sp. EF45047]|uniref:energy-coupling factor transporter transmembrane component T family protein n=1 Tax=Microbacterium sp. EF45047 TaxID=2809708 RepID=UPI00234A53E9|nr:energy-coupling factor transporter transmembrane protein EcfT [Microbacterium sp. EF45047]WCM54781.1 energy-coupling factor transporter transmembrane protein EcfT [Microbacterium sp. EF45047]